MHPVIIEVLIFTIPPPVIFFSRTRHILFVSFDKISLQNFIGNVKVPNDNLTPSDSESVSFNLIYFDS